MVPAESGEAWLRISVAAGNRTGDIKKLCVQEKEARRGLPFFLEPLPPSTRPSCTGKHYVPALSQLSYVNEGVSR